MNEDNLNKKIASATKWSTITQLLAKIISPITNMILARLLAPEAFGVVATVTMITSFADMFSDAGFQKYLVQREFKDVNEKYKSANVAFMTNITISLLLWGIIIICSDQLAYLVGNPGLGIVIIVACVQLPITAFSSIQMALYRRELDFKTLFIARLVDIFCPFVIVIPLAIMGAGYWSLITGNIATQLLIAVILTIKSPWKPTTFFDFTVLKGMLSFSIWSLIESISIWLTSWIDTFIISSLVSEYYLGIFKTSTSLVNALMATITASIVPVLFSSLSRLQNDEVKFTNTFLKMQRIVSIAVFPLGLGVYLYSELATKILLGNSWLEASNIIGVWALTSAIAIVFSNFSSEVYRAKGKPKLSFLAQILHLIVLVPTCIIGSHYGFWVLVYARAWIRIQAVFVNFTLMKYVIGFPIIKQLINVLPAVISAIVMGAFALSLQQLNHGLIWEISSIFICLLIYVLVLLPFKSIRKDLKSFRLG